MDISLRSQRVDSKSLSCTYYVIEFAGMIIVVSSLYKRLEHTHPHTLHPLHNQLTNIWGILWLYFWDFSV